jgi:hypothetical protein
VMGDVQSAKLGDIVVFQGHGLSKGVGFQASRRARPKR